VSERLSVIVPVFNEEEVLPAFYERLSAALTAVPCSAEILFVDDGSTDATPAVLEGLRARDDRVRVIRFTRNFGHQAALCAGLDHCTADAAVMIDADLQDPPELIRTSTPSGRRVPGRLRQRRRVEEGVLKRTLYHLFYRLLHLLANIEIRSIAGISR